MPVYIKIGRDDRRLNGITSQASVITRKGKTITLQWGAIISVNRKFYWAGPNLPCTKTNFYSSIADAEKFKRSKELRRLIKGFHKLDSNKRIHKRSKLKHNNQKRS